MENKNIKANIYRVQENDSVMCGYFCIGSIDVMLAGKKLIDYNALFSPHASWFWWGGSNNSLLF